MTTMPALCYSLYAKGLSDTTRSNNNPDTPRKIFFLVVQIELNHASHILGGLQ